MICCIMCIAYSIAIMTEVNICYFPLTANGLSNSGATVSRFSTEPEDAVVCADQKPSDGIRRGSAGVVGNMMLLNSHQNLHAPFTQDAPLMTEDMHEERLQAVEAFGDSFDECAKELTDLVTKSSWRLDLLVHLASRVVSK
ncbi:hypothetical protein CK203_057723 [Vitis vinifera]|uniref:Rab3 GTPase-activating protein catalytic subunit n=1 Tax=Vitis vinifera TaxID=29760 RepID=A0A438G0K3_VITVI|nr:hypothetical protein CK203_057723 [Vitis vinifera]